ncbi:hypothetical protein [Corynebacterium sp.]|uniref:hypothetical protein n=1 Tax=Corynebacterium sp. TaxID=1720 RepID=UPI0026DD5159|nr:hypothetical protein [Corynebacterium sp.]MDO4609863.1 hypothetical protein [Corynebacterium sp.]
MGTFVEWFDYAAYGYLAATIAPPYVRFPLRPDDIPAHGGLASAAGATAEKGRAIVDAAADAVAAVCAAEFGAAVRAAEEGENPYGPPADAPRADALPATAPLEVVR